VKGQKATKGIITKIVNKTLKPIAAPAALLRLSFALGLLGELDEMQM
jgi:hypothetical protein